MSWINVNDALPVIPEGKDCSDNVLVICNGKRMVMAYGIVDCADFDADNGEKGEACKVWMNCYGEIDGNAYYDDDYKPTHWQPIPKAEDVSTKPLFVPYQRCPICEGKGYVNAPTYTNETIVTCSVCKGAKIISQHIVN